MEGRAAEPVLLCKSRERGRRREGRDAEDDVVVGIDILGEADLLSGGVKGLVRKVKVASARKLVGEDFSAGEAHGGQDRVVQGLVERLDCMLLDGQGGILQEGEVLHVGRILQIDQNAEALPGFRAERRFQETLQAEGGESTCDDALGDGSGHGDEVLVVE